jgi:hypothetical protein
MNPLLPVKDLVIVGINEPITYYYYNNWIIITIMICNNHVLTPVIIGNKFSFKR